MLIEFSVENYLSIKERITLSMVASKDQTHENNVIKDVNKGLNILKTAVIFGANASGKTNVLKAINFVFSFLDKSHTMQQGKKILVTPFKLDRACIDKPSSFEIIFKYEEIKYAYGFSATEEKVIDEYLYYYPNGRQSIIFERDETSKYKFTNDAEKQKQIIEKFDSKNKLYLSTANVWEYEKAKLPFNWLTNNLKTIISHENLESLTVSIMKSDKSFEKQIKKLFSDIIEDIKDIKIEEVEFDNSQLMKYLSEEAKSKLGDELNSGNLISINTLHKMNYSDELVEFDLEDESDGTQKLFGLLGPWVHVLNNGLTLIVDELDIRLHSKLTRFLVELFHNPQINKNNAQLIFSTHDTNLLDQDLFRRDQIWFTQKEDDNSTDLYSLDDFPVRKDAAIEKGYLQGKYGAIPSLKGDCKWE